MKTFARRSVHACRRQLLRTIFLVVLSVFLAACAAVGPNIRIDYDRSVDFTGFQTYAFADELGTDRAGYSTLITTYFRESVDREMRARGYQYSESDPDLLVNFFANSRDVATVRARPTLWVGYGYYGYRYGMYHAWPLYADGAQTVHYRIGTANIDIVDAQRRQLIWEGVAEGKLTNSVMENPRPAIASVVADLFTRYPGRASAGSAR